MAKKKKKTPRKEGKVRDEVDEDLKTELDKHASQPDRIEFLLVSILRVLKVIATNTEGGGNGGPRGQRRN